MCTVGTEEVGLSRPLCRVWKVSGQVQGVGFRPFVFRLAKQLGLGGTVRNDPAGVTIEAWGAAELLERFEQRLWSEAPALARVEQVERVAEGPAGGRPRQFRIVASSQQPSRRGQVTVDAAVCTDCLGELFDPADRRYRHGLINCTNCGPRYSIVRDLPYDRPRTTMAGFGMCERCAAEYAEPSDRRFHAQPTCCPYCGPQVRLCDRNGTGLDGDPYGRAAVLLQQGGVLAMKGVGGFHLVARADRPGPVRRLRGRKRRDHKPFAIMVADLAAARQLVALSPQAQALLSSPICPILLAPRRDTGGDGLGRVAAEVAPGSYRLGVMVPYTPMQHLLFAEPLLLGLPLIMTSANLSDDPLIKDDAQQRLAGLCDAFLWHNRPIERAVDDSVLADTRRGLVPIRRARGYVPQPLPLPMPLDRPGLCVGGELKNAVAVVERDGAVLSQHIGDLSYPLAYERFQQTIDDLERLFEIEPHWVACDRHPQYTSRQYARRLAGRLGIDCYQIQHHHAHLAALAAEHGRADRIIGLVCDGLGYGDDGTAWGGEVLVADLAGYQRVGRVRPLRLPGGDAAARQTGRCAASWLFDLLGPSACQHPAACRLLPEPDQRRAIFLMLERDLCCPPSSGLGRLFDAAAALLGLCHYNHYEAMAGQMLESAAWQAADSGPARRPAGAEPKIDRNGSLLEFDTRPLLAVLLRGIQDHEPTALLAWQFHDCVAAALAAMAQAVSQQTGIKTVGLSGGVFCNAILTDCVAGRLERAGLEVLVHHQVPPNDGGLALGQAAIVGARRRTGTGV